MSLNTRDIQFRPHIKTVFKLYSQSTDLNMNEFTARTPTQLPILLQAFRKESGLTQKEVALRLGVTQQTSSALERNAETEGTARLLKLLGILGVELVLRKAGSGGTVAKSKRDSDTTW